MSRLITRPLAWLAMLIGLFVAFPSTAQSIVGHWVLTSDDTALFAADIISSPRGPVLTWRHPQHFNSDGFVIRDPSQGIATDQFKFGVKDGDQTSFERESADQGAAPFRILLRMIDIDRLAFRIVGMPADLIFHRIDAPADLGTWRVDAIYDLDIHFPTNAEMTALFDADQADRRGPAMDWSAVGPADNARRARTQQLLDAGALASGEDFYHAAFIFQHGGDAASYLKAHALATAAAARGYRAAGWISAATLDRYLQAIDRPQVFGTQFQTGKDAKTTQGEYDRTLISDALRSVLGVPSLADQERQRAALEKRSAAEKGD